MESKTLYCGIDWKFVGLNLLCGLNLDLCRSNGERDQEDGQEDGGTGGGGGGWRTGKCVD